MSVPQIPQAATRNSSSPSPISGIGTDSTTTCPLPRYTPARMCPGFGSRASVRSDMFDGLAHLIQMSPPTTPPLPSAAPASEISADTLVMYLSKNCASDSAADLLFCPNLTRSGTDLGCSATCPSTRGMLTCPSSVKIRFISSGRSSSTLSLMARIAIAGIPNAADSKRTSKLSISTASDLLAQMTLLFCSAHHSHRR